MKSTQLSEKMPGRSISKGGRGKKKKNISLRKAYKARIEIQPVDLVILRRLSSFMIHLWNMGIIQAERWLEENPSKPQEKRTAITAYTFNYWLTGKRSETVTLSDGASASLRDISLDLEREVLRKLAGSYQSYFELRKKKDDKARKPRIKEESWFQTLSWSTAFSIRDGVLSVVGVKGESIRIPIRSYLARQVADKKIVHVTMALRRGNYELSLVTASDLPTVFETPNFFRAIDLGAGSVAVTDSDGSEFIIPTRRPDKHWAPIIRAIEARAKNKRTKHSRGWYKLVKARRRVFNRSADQHISHQRKLADALVEPHVQCIVLGKPRTRLGLARSSGTNKQHFGAQNTGYLQRLSRFIKEKAEERGVRVIELPDPQRVGALDDPESKLNASRALLCEALKGSDLGMPSRFRRKGFSFQAC